MKVNVDGEAIKQFFLLHGEKFVVAAAGILLTLFGVKAVNPTGMLDDSKAPNRLAALAQQLGDKQQQSTPPEFPPPPGTVAVSVPTVLNGFVFNKPVHPPSAKRAQPKFLAAQDLQLTTGAGAIALGGKGGADAGAPGGGEMAAQTVRGRRGAAAESSTRIGIEPHGGSVSGRHWVVVHALVPYADQQAEYNKAFANASNRDPATDSPNYFYALIQRVEVPSETAAAKFPDEQPTKTYINRVPEVFEELKSWAGNSPEPLDASFVVPREPTGRFPPITMPVPPLLQKSFEIADVIHPKVLVLQKERAAQAKAAEKTGEEDKPMGDPLKPGVGDELFPGVAGPAKEAAKENARPTKSREAQPDEVKKPGEYLQFRFFDFAVQPGKAYRYRIQLIVMNPNLKKPDKDLQDEALKFKDQAIIYTDWSQASPAITIPPDMHLYASKSAPNAIEVGKPADFSRALTPNYKAERAVRFGVSSFDPQRAIEATKEFTDSLGAFADRVETLDLPEPSTGQLKKVDGFPFPGRALIADSRGGERITPPQRGEGNSPLTEPSETLFVDFRDLRKPQLIVRDEIDDSYAYQMKLKEMETAAAATPLNGAETGPSKLDIDKARPARPK